MDNQIGYKTTFWELVSKQPISIPTLQRDYIYGAGTEKTERVLSNMLSTFKTALDSVTQDPNDRKEETLDFVYGSDSIAKDFMPLDGQQRLTTLFLLHYYAALSLLTQQRRILLHWLVSVMQRETVPWPFANRSFLPSTRTWRMKSV